MNLFSSINHFLNLLNKHIYVKFENEWYDVLELVNLHPNGEKIFYKYHMKDITQPFNNNNIHKGIKNPKMILEKYKIYDRNKINKLNEKYSDDLC